MTLSQRIDSLAHLGQFLTEQPPGYLESAYRQAEAQNPWFTRESIDRAIDTITSEFLQKDALVRLMANYPVREHGQPKTIALVLAGNIPLVGFHDILCCYLAGHKASIKYSDKDQVLIPALLHELTRLVPASATYFERVEKISGYEAAIVTGSDNTARHFGYYLRNVPHIIRKNRTSTAILHGHESEENLALLAEDVFTYFGLGCRNVSHIWMPADFDTHRLFRAFEKYGTWMHHNKYKNNYDYNLALYLLNNEPFLQADNVLLRESAEPASRIACLHYSRYKNPEEVTTWLQTHAPQVQCIASMAPFQYIATVALGATQRPTLQTFADGVDTLAFLCSLPVLKEWDRGR